MRYTPSGSVRTISSKTCTISGRERCSFSMISMRAMKRCFVGLEAVDLLDLLVELRDLVLEQLFVARVLGARPSSRIIR